METVLKSLINHKNVLILGFGREGKSSLEAILKVGGYATVSVSDSRDVSSDVPLNVDCIFGDTYM